MTVGANRLRLLRDGTQAIPAMLDAIACARDEVLVEMYWFDSDGVGTTMRDALCGAARRGVRVAVVIDSVGSFGTSRFFFDPLRAAGGTVEEFGPLLPGRRGFSPTRIFFRDHRKLVVVDGVIAFVGGLNFADAWAPASGRAAGLRDDVLEARGPAAHEIRDRVADTWRRLKRPLPTLAPSRAPDAAVRVLINQFGAGPRRRIRRSYLANIRGASVAIDITSAYFLPRPLFVRGLCSAARRGVRVRLLIPARSDVAIVGLASSNILGRLLAAGVRIYQFGPRGLHAKTAVFDRRRVLVGSHNLDAYSARFNLECDLLVDSPDLAAIMERSFEQDLEESTALSFESWRARPLAERIAGRLAATLRGYL